MTIKTSIFAAVIAASFAFSPIASAGIHINVDKDIEDMSDKELAEAREGLREGLEEIRESRDEIAGREVSVTVPITCNRYVCCQTEPDGFTVKSEFRGAGVVNAGGVGAVAV